MNAKLSETITARIGENLPYLRRYARAMTGSRRLGDTYAAATLEAILEDLTIFDKSVSPKVALFKVFHSIWQTSGAQFLPEDSHLVAKAHSYLANLTQGTREALLLHTVEEMDFDDVGLLLDVTAEDAAELVNIAYQEMAKSLTGKVMIIEDEAIIAMDLEAIVGDMGHQVTGIAVTETASLDLFEKESPDLILSDIQLADGSSGIDAIARITAKETDIPVIFITAFPEKLLTGEGKEPAFLIAKPYTEQQVRSAVSQAMFFASTETLETSD